MPIIDVELVLGDDEALPPSLAATIAERAGPVLRGHPGGTWVKVRALSADRYAESDGGPPEGVRPVFVTVLEARLPAEEELTRRVEALTGVVADACARPAENVHVRYLPEAAGRQAFGGRLVGR